GVRIHETNGVILPGLIDLHGHPNFNVLAPWEPPQKYRNRYEWRKNENYINLVQDPENHLINQLQGADLYAQLRYAEVRALVAAGTAIQGAGIDNLGEPLVRNVDGRIFGRYIARASVFPFGKTANPLNIDTTVADTLAKEELNPILRDIAGGSVKAFYVH